MIILVVTVVHSLVRGELASTSLRSPLAAGRFATHCRWMDPSYEVRRRSDMIAAGSSRSEIDRRLVSGGWKAPYRGVVVLGKGPPADLRTLAAAAVATQRPSWAHASHGTAAALWQLDAPRITSSTLHVTVPREAVTRHRQGLRLHRALLEEQDRAEIDGVAVTSPARTALDLARTTGRWDSVIAADSALRRKLCQPDDFQRSLARMAGLRGVAAARLVVQDSEPRSRSAGETRLRLTLTDGGLPRPRAGYLLLNEFGDPIAEGDLVYDDLLVWLEYDGYAVHTQRSTFRDDRSRERMLRARGWEILRFVDVDLVNQRRLITEAGTALADAPRRIAALPADRSPEVARARLLLGL